MRLIPLPMPLSNFKIKMLLAITPELFLKVRGRHVTDGGDAINDKISQAFQHFNDNTCREDVLVKVAVINTLYNTAIRYIDPVVETINAVFVQVNNGELDASNPVALVDMIADTNWTSQRTNKELTRKNLSFASKFMHFQSERALPIYDSYIWIVMIGYLRRAGIKKGFKNPASYRDFYNNFLAFKEIYKLSRYSNYEIDKFLWQYGKQLISDIQNELEPKLEREQAKAELKKRLSIGMVRDAPLPAFYS